MHIDKSLPIAFESIATNPAKPGLLVFKNVIFTEKFGPFIKTERCQIVVFDLETGRLSQCSLDGRILKWTSCRLIACTELETYDKIIEPAVTWMVSTCDTELKPPE